MYWQKVCWDHQHKSQSSASWGPQLRSLNFGSASVLLKGLKVNESLSCPLLLPLTEERGTHVVRLILFPESITFWKRKLLVIAVELYRLGKKGFPPEQDSEKVANCFSWLSWLVIHQVVGESGAKQGAKIKERGKIFLDLASPIITWTLILIVHSNVSP